MIKIYFHPNIPDKSYVEFFYTLVNDGNNAQAKDSRRRNRFFHPCFFSFSSSSPRCFSSIFQFLHFASASIPNRFHLHILGFQKNKLDPWLEINKYFVNFDFRCKSPVLCKCEFICFNFDRR